MSKVIIDNNRINEVLIRGVEKIYPDFKSLKAKLKAGKKIRLYCGYDPTAPSLHIGHAISLRKLAQFQKLGHEVIMLIGDFTAMIGDPTDKTAARKKLTRKEVEKNLRNYKKQAGKILKFSGTNPAKIMHNSKWNDKLTFVDLIDLASNFTVQQMIARDMFQRRIKDDKPIYLHEFLYPLAQAYDSLIMDVDLEVGGNDQTFNMLCGRDLMKAAKGREKFVLSTKLLVDPSGKKMGKTEGNMINLDDSPKNMYGKIMSWPDPLIYLGFELCTDIPMEEIEEINKGMKEKTVNPRDAKARLAREITSIYHGKKAALDAEKEFNRIFKDKNIPSRIPGHRLAVAKVNIVDLLMETKLASSKSEAKRLIEQNAVKIDKKTISDWKEKIDIGKGMVIQAGKRRFAKLI